MAHVHDVVIDCGHPATLARFWAAVLDGYAVARYDEEEIERLRGLGIQSLEDDPTVLVEAGPGVVPRFFFQAVPEPKTVKNRVHLDLACDNVDSEIVRIIGLGARLIAKREALVVLADPEGNEFCLLR